MHAADTDHRACLSIITRIDLRRLRSTWEPRFCNLLTYHVDPERLFPP